MSIELNRQRVASAIIASECAQAALNKAIKLMDEAQRDLAGELKFGNDPATPDGAVLEGFGLELQAFAKALLNADLYAPHCGEAMASLSRIASAGAKSARPVSAPASMRPTGAAATNLARAVA
jgi:hypothetical protein